MVRVDFEKDSGVKPPPAKAVTGYRTPKRAFALYKTLHEVNRVFTSLATKVAYKGRYAERLDG